MEDFLARSEPVRRYAYGLIAPLVTMLILYGVLDAQSAVVWIGAATAVLAVPGIEKVRSKVTPV